MVIDFIGKYYKITFFYKHQLADDGRMQYALTCGQYYEISNY